MEDARIKSYMGLKRSSRDKKIKDIGQLTNFKTETKKIKEKKLLFLNDDNGC